MNEIDPDSTVIIDSSVLISIGGPENEKFQALAEYATQRDLVFQLPQRVLGEVDESPSIYEPQRTRIRAALDQGWMEIAPIPDYTSSTVAAVMDAVRARMAHKANSRDDIIPVVSSFRKTPPRGAGSEVNAYDRPYIVEKTDTALAGLAVHLLTTDPEASRINNIDG